MKALPKLTINQALAELKANLACRSLSRSWAKNYLTVCDELATSFVSKLYKYKTYLVIFLLRHMVFYAFENLNSEL